MKKFKFENFIRGWLIGNFEPSILKTKEIEVGIKHYKKGEKEPKTIHKKTFELTLVIFGSIKMHNETLNKNDIILLEPNDISSFECLKDSTLLVIKYPSNPKDKYIVK